MGITKKKGAVRGALACVAVVLGASLVAPVVSGAATSRTVRHGHGHGTVITMTDGSFGPHLVVGAGQFAGWSVYAITSDTPKTFGCTIALFHGGGPDNTFPCTGPDYGPTGGQSEWPALTTTAAPVAGAGVTKSLLGSVFRAKIGHQVTYAGHPLYLFDGGPGAIAGEGWDEPTLPPWHGMWWLVNPDGNFQEWSQTLSAQPLADNDIVVTALLETGQGFHSFPVYSFSEDTPSSSACGAACARLFPPLLTTGTPGLEGAGATGALGSVTRSDGTTQVTYDGHPLYLYGGEQIARVPHRGFAATGNGAGKAVGGGTFSVVLP